MGQITDPEQRRKPVNQEEGTVVCRSHQGCRNPSGALWVRKDLLSGSSLPVSELPNATTEGQGVLRLSFLVVLVMCAVS